MFDRMLSVFVAAASAAAAGSRAATAAIFVGAEENG
jgi:hypothetical protein